MNSPLCSTPTASGAWAGYTPGSRSLPEPRPRTRVPKTLKLQAVVLLLQSVFCGVLANSVRVHEADLQNVQQSSSEEKCPPVQDFQFVGPRCLNSCIVKGRGDKCLFRMAPFITTLQALAAPRACERHCRGSHMSDKDGCVPCTEGIDYTSHPNTLPSCIKCSICAADEDEITPCNSTQDTKCQCKPGTFKDENSPEFCQKCSECTNEQSENVSCTPNTNRICVSKDSRLIIGLIIGLVLAGLLLFLAGIFMCKPGALEKALQFMRRACPGREQHSENAVSLMELRTSNPENDSPAMKASEEPEEAPDSPTEAESLVPANGIYGIDEQPPVADGPHRP